MNKMINLYLDDLRDVPEGFVIARTVEEAIYYLENFNINILSLDHDLGEEENGNLLPTGYDLVKYICENGLRANKIYIHTDNPVGRENMYQTLLAAQKRGFIDKDIRIYNYPYIKNKYSEKQKCRHVY
ncbi:cyclic-phosphate processing receiver domain-containing protein [Clostridium thailandense]|uniref:cyclic-phosphate processing receiver domain-containing protein n=1 Tax=Clostridium thailandense TaxID=2794346 RepID=UPI0039899617